MPFCANCGAPVEGQFCGKCGTPLAGGAPRTGQPGGPAPQPPASGGGLTENVASALCYLAGLITGIIFLVLAPYNQSKTVRFHAFQSIFFSVAWIVIWILYMIVGGFLAVALPYGLGFLWGLIGLLVWLGGLILWILLMVKAYQNQKWVLPVIGPIADKQA